MYVVTGDQAKTISESEREESASYRWHDSRWKVRLKGAVCALWSETLNSRGSFARQPFHISARYIRSDL